MTARQLLLAARGPDGWWRGRLASSALATAVAVFALEGLGLEPEKRAAGRAWLERTQLADGGWGDTTESPANLSTTTLVWAALGTPESARAWIERRIGGALTPARLAEAVAGTYGADRTFSAPILALCALAGALGAEPDCWRHVPALPFELAALPRQLFAGLGLPVVSYALPALIAIGQLRHVRAQAWNPLREMTRGATLTRLQALQPHNGGFLEATPLTAFVAMSLAGIGLTNHPVAQRAAAFLSASMRPDGSWPIDSDLSTWVTSLAVNALDELPDAALERYLALQQQHEHPCTGAAPGGWAWTDLPGGVPDADDTAGALLALARRDDARVKTAAERGLTWLLDLQNRDGGIPTFCRGWGTLPFDRSAPDITAHALRAFAAWRARVDPALRERIDGATRCALDWLQSVRRADGAWIPLWFGNQQAPGCDNPVFGTARVVRALADIAPEMTRASVDWLVAARGADGCWGGAPGIARTLEETAVCVEALTVAGRRKDAEPGACWLAERAASSALAPSPIGLYFARLWYSEELYPLALVASALRVFNASA